jgi:uncharacterized cupin superfamily protein
MRRPFAETRIKVAHVGELKPVNAKAQALKRAAQDIERAGVCRRYARAPYEVLRERQRIGFHGADLSVLSADVEKPPEGETVPKIDVELAPVRTGSGYPEPFRQKSLNRSKRALGDAAGLAQFGVNLVRLPPGEWSSQRHWHSHEDEFVYMLEGEVVLITDAGEEVLRSGDCAAFPKNAPDGHHMINKSQADAVYLEVGTRSEEDVTEYPDIDMRALPSGFVHRNGAPY